MSDVDLNEIKAGKYVLVALSWDEVTSKPGEPYDFVTHRKGAEVDLDVEQARRLVVAGAVVPAGEYEEPGDDEQVGQDTGDWWGDGDEPTTVDGILDRLDELGNPQEAVAAALVAEENSSSPRSTLIDKLKALAAAS